jgi:SNF2 family DNA or RNA helicase
MDQLLEDGGVAITTYGTAVSSLEMLSKTADGEEIKWDVIVLDEGHKIKDPSKKTSKAIMNIAGKMKVVLTGTPIMNNLGELWALFNYCCDSQLLGDRKIFKQNFEDVIVRVRILLLHAVRLVAC